MAQLPPMPIMNLEFIKLAKTMREAQKEAPRSQKAERRARSLEQIFDAKIEKYESQLKQLLRGEA